MFMGLGSRKWSCALTRVHFKRASSLFDLWFFYIWFFYSFYVDDNKFEIVI